jgi:hypothetical protein
LCCGEGARCRGPVAGGEREGRTDSKPEAVGVGSVVNASGVAARDIQQCHGKGRGRAEYQHDGDPPPARFESHETDDDKRPDEVELFFNGEGPEVSKQFGSGVVEIA